MGIYAAPPLTPAALARARTILDALRADGWYRANRWSGYSAVQYEYAREDQPHARLTLEVDRGTGDGDGSVTVQLYPDGTGRAAWTVKLDGEVPANVAALIGVAAVPAVLAAAPEPAEAAA